MQNIKAVILLILSWSVVACSSLTEHPLKAPCDEYATFCCPKKSINHPVT